VKIVVAHTGARRGYAVPSILETAGMLEAFYTDSCADAGVGKLARLLEPFGQPRSRLRRLAGRRLPPNIVAKTSTFARATPWDYWAQRPGRDPVETYRAHLTWQCELGNRMAKRGFGHADWLHAFLDEFPTLIAAAKQRGLRVVSEVYILLSSDRILREERKQFPGWEPDVPDFDAIYREIVGERRLLLQSDYLLCPSEAVRDDIVENFGFPLERTRLVPYGAAASWFEVKNVPKPGRILFAGAAELRKGIHYLGMAAEQLLQRGRQYHFRIAGNVESSIANQQACRHLDFIGRVPRSEMASEFAAADVFVLPSLAEGSAGVIYEALAAGVPVVTTKAAGSVVRHGQEGFIVSERDASGLADAIEQIVEDRIRRDAMALSARERAAEFTWENYGRRLVGTLEGLSR
jgi:glycosyltransferase involved in cell wall biosynthesis